MTMVEALSDEKIKAALQGSSHALHGWEHQNNTLIRTFKWKDFVEAFGFMARVAILAEKADHHPEWSNVYNVVEIRLTTHDAGNKVSERDLGLASQINEIL